jgi:hypothetical protein
MEIKNTSKRPLKVPLPGGKRLFLKPGGKGQILPKAVDHPPVKKLIDDGELEVLDLGKAKNKGASGSGGISSSQDGGGGGGIRHIGDR